MLKAMVGNSLKQVHGLTSLGHYIVHSDPVMGICFRCIAHLAIPKLTHVGFVELLITVITNPDLVMKTYGFTITLEEQVLDLDRVNAFYGKVDDASMAGGEGKTFIHFDREADSLDAALGSAISEVLNEGWHVLEISVEPECVLPAATS